MSRESRRDSFIVSNDSDGGRYLISVHICAAGIRNRFPDQMAKSIGIDSLISWIPLSVSGSEIKITIQIATYRIDFRRELES